MEGRVALMGAAFFCYLAVMTVFDLASTSTSSDDKKTESTPKTTNFEDPEFHQHTRTSAFSAPTVKVLYCIS